MRFFTDLTNLWLGLKGRCHFENLSRQGNMSSECYRSNFSKAFDFKVFNLELFEYLAVEKIWVFDPTFLSKSGKKTPGIGYFWSGCKQQISRGIELAGLAIVDVKNHTSFHYYATQTILSEGQELLVKDAFNLLARF